MHRLPILAALLFVVALTPSVQAEPATSTNTVTGPSHQDIMAAVRHVFPDGYKEFATITYETVGTTFYPASVTFLLPEKSFDASVSSEKRKNQACKIKQKLDMECACETLEVGPAKDYVWAEWEDKRVVPVTITFNPSG